MAVDEGTFVLYSRIAPPLQAGDYRLTARQSLSASKDSQALGAAQLPVADLPAHFRVRAPRFALPPDQVLSTFPPANSEGAFGMRLPQIVIKRRTLPWERNVGPGGTESTPWLALVLIAEGEAELKLNESVADCLTPGVTVDGLPESEKGNCLLVRKSIIDKIFPTRLDVPLLAHAREVDIHDTELMMGDDDGFLAVVIANRLPLPAKDAAGNEVPIKYLACLINLEQQFEALRERAPEPVVFTRSPKIAATTYVNTAGWDQIAMGMPLTQTGAGTRVGAAAAPAGTRKNLVGTPSGSAVSFTGASDWSLAGDNTRAAAEVYAEMARPFTRAEIEVTDLVLALDQVYRFPVLLHWSFTSVGDTTFQRLMERLGSGLLGTVEGPTAEGRPPLEVVETGHVGLGHRTRRGDEVRVWYRGPFAPHPTQEVPDQERLALAHASDQLRIVIPDGREDLSLAAAFEIGRLLALSRPSMIASLLRWRQLHYQAARREVIWRAQERFLELLAVEVPRLGPDLGIHLGRGLARAIAARPEQFLGNPRPPVVPGRRLPIDGPGIRDLATAFGIGEQILQGGPELVLQRLPRLEVPVAPAPDFSIKGGRITTPDARLGRQVLAGQLDQQLGRLARDTVPGGRRTGAVRKRAPDALDRLLDALAEEEPE